MNSNSVPYANIDPALSMGPPDLDFAIPEGFEQAMGMTLGEGGFANYFSDDYFLGSLMDSFPTGAGGPPFDVGF